MMIDWRRTLVGAIVGLVLLGLLIWVAGIEPADLAADLAMADPGWALVALAASGACLICRTFAIRALASRRSGVPVRAWLRLTVRHQLIFILAPSGSGDLVFPLLARRHAGLSAPEAVRMLALTRLRDLLVVATIGATGLLIHGFSPTLGWVAVVLGVVAVLGTERIAGFVFGGSARLSGATRIGRFLHACTDTPPPDAMGAVMRSGLILIAWIAAGASVYAAFTAVGRPLSLAETCLILAALNVVGALAISIGGLGVSEAGATGVLMLVGETAVEAAAFAVLARPLLLVVMALAAVSIDLAVWARARMPWT